MLVARSFVGGVLALSLCAFGCGGGAQPAPATPMTPAASGTSAASGAESESERAVGSASSRISRLIPTSTAVYIQLESFRRFDAVMGRLARANEDIGRQIDELARQLHRMLPGDERQIHRDRPLGVAISFPPDREPQLTFVLPMRDVASFKRSLQLSPSTPSPVFDGTYLAVSSSSLYERPREPVELAAGVPDQAMTVRLDLARLDHRYGSQLRLALVAMAAGETPKVAGTGLFDLQILPYLQQVADPLLFALAVGRRAEIAVDVDAERLHMRCEVETREAGVLAGWTASSAIDLAPLARSMVASDSIGLLAGCDAAVLRTRLAPLLTSTSAQSERLAGMFERFVDPFGSMLGISGSLAAGEAHFSLQVLTEDRADMAREMASNFELFSRGGLGVAVQSKSAVEVEGVEVQDLLVHFDAISMCALTGEVTQSLPLVQARLDAFSQSLFGADTVHVRIVSFKGRGLIAIGNDDVWFRRTLLWAKQGKNLTPPDVAYALEHLGEVRAAAILRIDMSRRLQGPSSLLAQARALYEPVRSRMAPIDVGLAQDPKPLTIAVGAEGRTLRLGLSMGLPSEISLDMARR
jgi:hypothetical protein